MNEVYVGNLAYSVSENELRDYFSEFGQIDEIKLITDRATGQSKGFGFIKFKTQAEAEAALKANGKTLNERALKVNMSRPKERTDSGRGGRSGGGGGAGGRRF